MPNIQIITILALTILGAQAKPDYNGTWVVNRDRSVKAIQDGLPATHRMTITLTEKEVTIVYPSGGLVCGFGKEPTENDQLVRGAVCSAKWDGDQLVATLTQKSYSTNPTTSSTFSMQGDLSRTVTRLSRAGTELNVTSTIRLASGKEGTRSSVYDKAR